MDISSENVTKHTKSTLKDAVTITFAMVAAVLAAEGRMPDLPRLIKFIGVYVLLVVLLKIQHNDVAKQIMTAVSIGCGSKLLEVISKK